jgi:hypothetical protein
MPAANNASMMPGPNGLPVITTAVMISGDHSMVAR